MIFKLGIRIWIWNGKLKSRQQVIDCFRPLNFITCLSILPLPGRRKQEINNQVSFPLFFNLILFFYSICFPTHFRLNDIGQSVRAPCVSFRHQRLVLGNVNTPQRTSVHTHPFTPPLTVVCVCVCATYLLSDTQIRFGDKRFDFDWPKVIETRALRLGTGLELGLYINIAGDLRDYSLSIELWEMHRGIENNRTKIKCKYRNREERDINIHSW